MISANAKREKTEEDFYEEDGTRWFKTGDIGLFEDDGVLKIIDRKKDLVKLQGGEYVSYGKVESVLKTQELVENICIHADPSKDFCIAIMVPNRNALQELSETLQVDPNAPIEDLCKDSQVIQKVIETLRTYALQNGLEKFD